MSDVPTKKSCVCLKYVPRNPALKKMAFLFWGSMLFHGSTPPETNMTMENPLFEDVFPIEHWDFPISNVMLVFRGVHVFGCGS